MSPILVISLLALLVIAAYVAFKLTVARWADETTREFEREFPGQCAYCSLMWYGITHGHESLEARPKPHKCKEGMSRWAFRPTTREEK